MVVGKATTSTSSRASSSRLPPALMTLGTSTRFLLVAMRAPDRRMLSHSGYAYYKPSPWTSSKSSSTQSGHRVRQDPRGSQAQPTCGSCSRRGSEDCEGTRPLQFRPACSPCPTRGSNDGVDGPLAASTWQTGVLKNHQEWERSMSEITTIGLDLAKHVFQVHGIDAQGTTVLRKRLRRGQVLAFFSRIPRCVVG